MTSRRRVPKLSFYAAVHVFKVDPVFHKALSDKYKNFEETKKEWNILFKNAKVI